MSKLLQVIKSRKYLALGLAIAVISLGLNVRMFVRADDTPNTIPPQTLQNDTSTQTPTAPANGATQNTITADEGPAAGATPINLVHANCIKDLEWGTTPSSTYNPDSPYNLSFVYGTPGSTNPEGLNGFYDINGDNLPDYVYSHSYTSSGGNVVESTFEGCVYLNNGQGWTRAFRCKAHTYIENGQITSAQYYGDCAGQ